MEKIGRTAGSKDWPLITLRPILEDKHDESGVLNGAYFHQDLLVARKVFLNKPDRHIDIGSRTDGFVAHVAVFRPIEIIDIRPQHSKVENISFLQGDLMNPVSPQLVSCCDSLSSLHAIEHFGLGRYGDPIDPAGHTKALDNIHSMLKPGGTFYFAVPMGPQEIEFNAQRIFSLRYLLQLLKDRYSINDFSFVDDKGDLHTKVALNEENINSNCGCTYGCAIFDLRKL
ncbi:MAG: DUF268 domain-containing protein [Chitinophagaceae bacterium]|nr:DUF268 domain-containing protein [Chitinophagaceae bacterium]